MKHSRHVAAPLLASAALALLAGCRPQEMQCCVKEYDHIADDRCYCGGFFSEGSGSGAGE